MADKCRSCGAPGRWVRTQAGKLLLIDRDPVPDGNLVFVEPGTVRYLRAVEEPAEDRFVAHFATCPDSASWRKRKG